VELVLGCVLLDELPHRQTRQGDDIVVELDMRDDMRGPAGSLHGGIVAVLVDCAGASCVAAAGARPVATLQTSIEYLAAARVGPIRAVATLLRASKAFGVADVKVFDVGKDNRLVAAAHVTVSYLEGGGFDRKVD
jgi:uncharacterized protein (TIGR00369 family)